jgi:putative glutamine amidotransferase
MCTIPTSQRVGPSEEAALAMSARGVRAPVVRLPPAVHDQNKQGRQREHRTMNITDKRASNWMLYGAYGVIGRKILDLALKRGLRPILGGRDSERLMALAQTTGLGAVTVSIDEVGRDDSTDRPSTPPTLSRRVGVGGLGGCGRVLPLLTCDARIAYPMPDQYHDHVVRPRVGVPWRTAEEEAANNRPRIDKYLRAVERAGGEPVLVSLRLSPGELRSRAAELDAFLLTGSPADVDPAHFHAKRHPATVDADFARERTDFALLEHALATGKPVLAICYGVQSLNVFLGGNLIQDIPSELGSKICHDPDQDETPSVEYVDAMHDAQFDAGRVLELSGAARAEVNSSHHQSVHEPGRGLRITAHAPDGVVEAVEWIGDSNWVVGVQWHPERMSTDSLAQALFRDLLTAARQVRVSK